MKCASRLLACVVFCAFTAFPILAVQAPLKGLNSVPTQVVELFTSQGCSSCPASNALVNDWSKHEDVLALTYSVDYWDYLGWKDTFADPKFSARQRAYGKTIGHGRVYTPQMIVNGQIDKPRFARAQIDTVTFEPNALSFTVSQELLMVSSGPVAYGELAVYAEVVIYTPGLQSVSVKRGENQGRDLLMTNVVSDVHDLGVFTGEESRFKLRKIPKGQRAVVFFHRGECGPIIAAAHVPR